MVEDEAEEEVWVESMVVEVGVVAEEAGGEEVELAPFVEQVLLTLSV